MSDNGTLTIDVNNVLDQLRVLHSNNDGTDARGKAEEFLKSVVKSYDDLDVDNYEPPATIDSKWILELPFICLPKSGGDDGGGGKHSAHMVSHMSRDSASVKRAPLKKAYLFKVAFQSYSFQEKAPQYVGAKGKVMRAVRYMLSSSAEGYPAQPGEKYEIQQLCHFNAALMRILLLFGYEIDIPSPPRVDFRFLKTENQNVVVLAGEGKDATALPEKLLPDGLSVKLCNFGFATWLAAHYDVDSNAKADKKTEVEEMAKDLRMKLNLTADKKKDGSKGKSKEVVQANDLTDYKEVLEKILKNATGEEKDFHKDIMSVNKELQEEKIGPLDALQLWAAVMKACHATVPMCKRFTIAMSIKFIWFIELQVDERNDVPCRLCISDPVAVGSPGSNLKLLSFLTLASESGAMSEADQKKWEQALDIKAEDGTKNNARVSSSSEVLQNPSKKHKPGGTGEGETKQQGLSVTHQVPFHQGEIGPQIDEKSAANTYLRYDKYGVVPYFYQIGDVVGLLGKGRCGNVKKIKWRNGFAAKKEYMLDPYDDGRCNADVFEHEREVLLELQPLWRKYVPAIEFHKYWPGQPVLGLQLGEPMPRTWSEWSEEERRQADEAIAAVERRGWIHGDVEARNFARLTRDDGSTSIALVDFEDAYRKPED